MYFSCTAVLSVVAHMENGDAVKVGTISNEGFHGIDVLAGVTKPLKRRLPGSGQDAAHAGRRFQKVH